MTLFAIAVMSGWIFLLVLIASLVYIGWWSIRPWYHQLSDLRHQEAEARLVDDGYIRRQRWEAAGNMALDSLFFLAILGLLGLALWGAQTGHRPTPQTVTSVSVAKNIYEEVLVLIFDVAVAGRRWLRNTIDKIK